MQDARLLKKAWSNLLNRLTDIKTQGEAAIADIGQYDEKRRLDGKVVQGRIREYCRCGKKDCPEFGKAGHTLRYHLQNADGATHIAKSKLEAYQTALEYNKRYRRAESDIETYRTVCEKGYKALGYVGRSRTFESYLWSFM